MDSMVAEIIRDSVGMGILLLVLIGLYKLVSRFVGLAELGLSRFLNDFERMSDGIATLAETERHSRATGARPFAQRKTGSLPTQ